MRITPPSSFRFIRHAAAVLAAGTAAAVADSSPASSPAVSDADLVMSAQAFGAVQRDRSVDGNPLRVGGKEYASGLGAHAVSELPVTVPAGAARFTGAVGVDDEVGPGKGSVKFRILSGNAVLWESPEMKAGDPAAAFDVAVPSAIYRKLYLQVDDLGENSYDHADWVDLAWKAPVSGLEGSTVHGSTVEDGSAGILPASAAASCPADARNAGEGTGAPRGASHPARVFKGAEFGLTPGSREDQTPALRKALQALREAPGSTLLLAKGDYHFWHTGALKRHFHISNHDQPTWQPVGVPLVDLKNVTIDGQGSTFVFHGLMQPVLVQDSEKVTLRGIGVDYEIPHHSQGVVTKVEPGSYELFVDPVKFPHEIRNGWFVFKGEGWETGDWGNGIVFDGKTREIVAGTGDFGYRGKLTAIGGGHYRIEKNLAKARIKAGDVITMRHSSRPHPGVVLYRAKDTVLENCPIHSAAGMGLLAQRSENIRVTGGGICLRPGSTRYFTTNADATHFSNCRGALIVEGGVYEGMMDDAINVHATCLRIEEKLDARTLRCRYVHGQSVGFEVVLPGETIRFIQAKWLTPRDPRKVAAVRRTKTDEVILTLAADAPADLGKGDAVENADWFPSVTFRGNLVRNNRARGSLFTTPEPVLVEGNRFLNSSGSAILLAGDANGWYESGACHDVVIRRNLFHNNLTSRFQFTEALISIYPEIPDLRGQTEYYHRKVRIEENVFETFDVPLVYAISTDGLVFQKNKITYNNDYPAWKKEPFILRRCANVVVEGNTVAGAGKGAFTAASVKRELTPPEAVTVK